MFLVTQPGTVLVAAVEGACIKGGGVWKNPPLAETVLVTAVEDACIHVTLPLRTTPYRGRLPIFR